jgi:hypothetical protein
MPATYRTTGAMVSGSSATPSFAKPVGTVTGDIMIAVFAAPTSSGTLTPDQSGWTTVTGAPGVLGSKNGWYLYRTVGAGDPATYTFTLTSSGGWDARPIVYQDASGVDAAQFSTSGLTTTPSATGVTTSVPGCTIFAGYFALGGSGTPTAASGYTLRIGDGDEAYMDKVQASAGATGTVTPSFSADDEFWMAVIALAPLASGGANPWYAYAQQ